ASYQDDNNVVITNPSGAPFKETLYIDGLRVGDAAQTTAALGAAYQVTKGLKVDANYRYADRLFANIDPVNFKTQTARDYGALQLPSFGLLDAGMTYKMFVGKDKANSVNFRLNVNNVLDKVYIAESRTNNRTKTQADFTTEALYNNYINTQTYNGVDVSNQVYFGFGRTWNLSVAYKF
ncbi:MAG: hypothetical protein RLY43_2394, partial [Bacteroidota bacterium]